MSRGANLVGQRYDRLFVVSCEGIDASRNKVWRCLCDCGQTITTRGIYLKQGKATSCKCKRYEPKSHGQYGTGAYVSWENMKSRCNNDEATGYENYGGRGISVCERWDKFENFLADMGERPEGMSIDRINVNGNYEPGNCRWLHAQSKS